MAGLIELDLDPDVRTLRSFGFIALGGFGLLAGAAYTESLIFSFGLGELRSIVAIGLGALGLLSGLLSLVAPRANRPIYVGLSLLTFPIGFVMSYLVFGILYFTVMTPIALLFRLIRRDELRLRPRMTSASYWSDARPQPDRERYFRQF